MHDRSPNHRGARIRARLGVLWTRNAAYGRRDNSGHVSREHGYMENRRTGHQYPATSATTSRWRRCLGWRGGGAAVVAEGFGCDDGKDRARVKGNRRFIGTAGRTWKGRSRGGGRQGTR